MQTAHIRHCRPRVALAFAFALAFHACFAFAYRRVNSAMPSALSAAMKNSVRLSKFAFAPIGDCPAVID